MLEAVGPDGYVDCVGSSSSSSSASSAANKDGQHQQRRPQLPMVDACIRESQRLYPVAPFVVRHLTSDLRLKDGERDRILKRGREERRGRSGERGVPFCCAFGRPGVEARRTGPIASGR